MYSQYFNSIEHLEPKCPGCGKVIEYGTTTRFNEEISAHQCLECNTKIP